MAQPPGNNGPYHCAALTYDPVVAMCVGENYNSIRCSGSSWIFCFELSFTFTMASNSYLSSLCFFRSTKESASASPNTLPGLLKVRSEDRVMEFEESL